MCTIRRLVAFSLAVGAVALGAIALSVATNNWLITVEERGIDEFVINHDGMQEFPEYDANYTDDSLVGPLFNPSDLNMTLPPYFVVKNYFGLWRFCTVSTAIVQSCIALSYRDGLIKTKEDGQETSTAIAEAQRGATPVFVLSLILIMTSTVLMVIGNMKNDKKTLIAGIVYINAGLCIAVGIVLYITFVNDEARYANPDPENKNKFRYYYGWSAYLMGISFLASEAAAVLCITLYLKRHSSTEDMVKIIPGLEKQIDAEDMTYKAQSNPTLIL